MPEQDPWRTSEDRDSSARVHPWAHPGSIPGPIPGPSLVHPWSLGGGLHTSRGHPPLVRWRRGPTFRSRPPVPMAGAPAPKEAGQGNHVKGSIQGARIRRRDRNPLDCRHRRTCWSRLPGPLPLRGVARRWDRRASGPGRHPLEFRAYGAPDAGDHVGRGTPTEAPFGRRAVGGTSSRLSKPG